MNVCIHVCICMYVRMYVCMYVCNVCICTCVCMYSTYVCMYQVCVKCIYAMYVCMYVCRYAFIHLCTYVYICNYVHICADLHVYTVRMYIYLHPSVNKTPIWYIRIVFLILDSRFRFQRSVCGICGGQGNTGTGFPESFGFPLSVSSQQYSASFHSSIIDACSRVCRQCLYTRDDVL
jgi:hypothetical protein